MRPTFSIIFFTVLSGAGYGVLFLLGLAFAGGVSIAPYQTMMIDDFHFGREAAQAVMRDPRIGLALSLAIGILLSSIGLLASVAHLGQPLRAWRAFSQWRSSWLSREGIAALLTFVPIVAIGWLLYAHASDDARTALRIWGALLALGSVATVFCTGNIYSCLKPIRAWHNPYVVPGYLLLALYSGALWMAVLGRAAIPELITIGLAQLSLLACVLVIAPACIWLKWRYWRSLDATVAVSAGAATGLDRLGSVRSFEQPHTEENYLTHEMGFVLARKHSRRLRKIALSLILLAPIMLFPLTVLIGSWAAWIALIAGIGGVFVERWLFFAEAKHAVMAYYAR
jgi:sulfite dehydrogenase (quinone) subunit SoeC